ncbi:MAG: tetratricopeptide repeat protein, partial [Rudaea sp.]
QAAELGYAPGQLALATAYEHGRGVAKSISDAHKWYRKAAGNGNVQAQFKLGDIYDQGQGVTSNPTEAVAWYRKAAEQDDGRAQARLGELLRDGLGVKQDQAAAVRWFRKAAEHGFASAQLNLGRAYATGSGVPQDSGKAYYWLMIGSPDALGVTSSTPVLLLMRLRLSAAQLHARSISAANWEKSEHCNVTPVMFCSALDELGIHVPAEERERLKHTAISDAYVTEMDAPGPCYQRDPCALRLAARMMVDFRTERTKHLAGFFQKYGVDQGYAQKRVLEVAFVQYLNNRPVDMVALTQLIPPPPPPPPTPESSAKTVTPFRKAAEQGDARAQYNLGMMYAGGSSSVLLDETKATKWFRKAADQGFAPAQYFLGESYDSGEGVAKDVAVAAKWYRKAADQGYAGAQFNLGIDYAQGTGVSRNLEQACYWLSLARPDAQKPDATRDKVCSQLDSTQRHAIKIQVAKAQSSMH